MTFVKLEDVEKLVARMGLRCLESEENWIRALRALPIADGATDRVIAAILAAAYEGSQGEAIVGVEDAISALRSLPTDDGWEDIAKYEGPGDEYLQVWCECEDSGMRWTTVAYRTCYELWFNDLEGYVPAKGYRPLPAPPSE